MGETGIVEVSNSEKEGGKWVSAYNYIHEDENGKAGDSKDTAHSRKKSAGTAQIPVGKYILKSRYNDFEKLTPFEVKSSETTKLHIIFRPFLISSKCTDSNTKVSYEVYGSDGRLIYDKKLKCSDIWKITLDDGSYNVEASIEGGKGEAKFSVGSGKSNKLILDLSNLNHEEEIKADTPQEAVVIQMTPKKEVKSIDAEKSEKFSIGGKQIEIKGISEEDAEKIKNLGAMLGALGGMMQSSNQASSQEKKAEQDAKNAEADKEFDEMSKDLDMYTK